jgi:hypothetical protein
MQIAGQTGWAEDFIFWELPFARALQYRHYVLAAAGEWTVRPESRAAVAAETEEVLARWEALRSGAALYRAEIEDELVED